MKHTTKRLLALLLVLCLGFSLAACAAEKDKTDVKKILETH